MNVRKSIRFSLMTLVACIACFFCSLSTAQVNTYTTVRIKIDDRDFVGYPMARDAKSLALLRRDGRLTTLPFSNASNMETVSKNFRPFSSDKIRQSLQKEFGAKYQVSVTENFVVVHPHGDFSLWALPFERLFQRFKIYFANRGLTPDRPEFPMVAIVLRTRNEFDRFLKTYHRYDRNILGYYSPRSNRIITYAPSGTEKTLKTWNFQGTLIHEAVHQTAYNTGIHSRFAPVPRWIPEGLAMMFEAKGVNNSNKYSLQKDRINLNRLAALKRCYKEGKVQGRIDNIVASDKLFRTDPERAYALAWGLTFFLAEKYPSEYFAFIKHDGDRTDFQQYTTRDRLRNFARTFGSDFKGLEKQMERFIKSLD